MKGNKLTAFLVYLVVGILGGIAAVCTCYLGLLAVLPYAAILNGVIYVMATGQPVSRPKGDAYQSDGPGAYR
jgi:hypothetical protein